MRRHTDVIAIPSYQRAETLRDKTLKLLGRLEVNPSMIQVFVADEVERERYASTLEPGSYRDLVVAEPGMGAVRRFVQGYYPEGTRVLNMDDDLKELVVRDHDKAKHPITPGEFDTLCADAWRMANKTGIRLWGIYPVANQFFMKHTVTTDLRYVIGAFWGVVNTRDTALSVTLDDKEDFERTLKFYEADRGVLRFNYVALDTNYYTEPGGMQVERTEARVEESAKVLATRFPHLCVAYHKKTSGHWELRLKDKRKKPTAAGSMKQEQA